MMEVVLVEEDARDAFIFSPFRFIHEKVVVENPQLLPSAPIVFAKLVEERNRRKVLHYRFATLAELVLYFSTVNTDRGRKLYRYFLTAFLRKHHLVKDMAFPVTLSYNDKVYAKQVGKEIYSLLYHSRRPFCFQHKKRGLESPQGRNCSPREVSGMVMPFPLFTNSYAKTLIFCQPL